MTTVKQFFSALLFGLALCGLLLPESAKAQDTIFLPIISNGGSPLGEGSAKVAAAGRLSTDLPGPGSNGPISDPVAMPPETFPTGPIKAVECSIQDWSSEDFRDIGDRVLLNGADGVVYPGALIQGRELEAGSFTPVSIPRAGGRISIQGLSLPPGSKTYSDVSEPTNATVGQAVHDLLANGSYGTSARLDYQVAQTYSSDDLLFRLGISGKFNLGFMGASLKSHFETESQDRKNYVFLKFVQPFYDITFDTPATPASVFRDGERFTDPRNQIGAGNPPLYVQKVSYGRIVVLIAKSSYSVDDIKASLDGAFNYLAGSGKVSSGLTMQDVLASTEIHYAVIGGGAGEGVKPISAPSAEAMFEAVKEFIAKSSSAEYSAANPGWPIAYTLRYLANNKVARMSYSVAYRKKDCNTILRKPSVDVAVLGPFGGHWGGWGAWERCPEGQMAFQFAKKVEAPQGDGDDTALNGIRLDCSLPMDRSNVAGIKSSEGPWGGWDPERGCPDGELITGAALRIEGKQGSGDDTGAVDVKFRCSGGSEITTPTALSWGDWESWQDCPTGSAITALVTRVEGKQSSGDDTALNDAQFVCSTIP